MIGDDDPADGLIARLRDGSPVGAWMLKAQPDVWDIGSALRDGVELDSWRLAPSYRAELVHVGHPCVLWITRGDNRVPSGVWAIGEVTGEPDLDVGDPDDDLWRDARARRELRPMVPVRLRALRRGVSKELIRADPRLASIEMFRVPRMGNPAALTPEEWWALEELVLDLEGDGTADP
ncbi:hypothetical protein BH10ACT3_BH10ACT3_08350 [soil metagenome]